MSENLKLDIQRKVFSDEEKAELDNQISKLNMFQRIRLLEFMTGMRKIEDVQKDECTLVGKILFAKICGYISPELNPSTWNLEKFQTVDARPRSSKLR